jgi:hypothetical protein
MTRALELLGAFTPQFDALRGVLQTLTALQLLRAQLMFTTSGVLQHHINRSYAGYPSGKGPRNMSG